MQSYHWGYEERKEGEPLHLGILDMSVEVLEHAYFLPDGYRIVGMSYNERTRVISFLLTSDALPEVQEAHELPRVNLFVTTDTLPDHPGYRRYTTEIKWT